MAHLCCCGNEISAKPKGFKLTSSPCQCEKQGPGRGTMQHPGIPSHVFKKQWEERRRAGLPMETDTEKGVRKKW